MFLRLHRPIALLVLLSLFLGLGVGSVSGRWATRFALEGTVALAPGGFDGLHDLCVSPSPAAFAPSDLRATQDSIKQGDQASPAPEAPSPVSYRHEHCPDCLVRLAAAPPPHLPDLLSAGHVPAQRTRLRLSAPMLSSPWTSAHGARAPPKILI